MIMLDSKGAESSSAQSVPVGEAHANEKNDDLPF
jgi:hypothetical protein